MHSVKNRGRKCAAIFLCEKKIYAGFEKNTRREWRRL